MTAILLAGLAGIWLAGFLIFCLMACTDLGSPRTVGEWALMLMCAVAWPYFLVAEIVDEGRS